MAISWDTLLTPAEATEEALGGPGHWATCLPASRITGFQAQFRLATAGLISIDAEAGRPEDSVRATDFDRKFVPLYASLVPTQPRRLLASLAARAVRRLDVVLVGGAAAGARLLEATRAAGLRVITIYGTTEICGGCVYDGSPIEDICVAVEDGRTVLSGSAVALGYVGGPDFAGMLHTSDVDRLEIGRLIVLGRVDDTIATGGVAIMPAVIEEALVHSRAGESVVAGIGDDEWGEIAVAVVGATGLSQPTAFKMCRMIAEEHGKAYVPRLFPGFSDLGFSDSGHSESRPPSPEPSDIGPGDPPLTAPGKSDRCAIHELVHRALDRRSLSS